MSWFGEMGRVLHADKFFIRWWWRDVISSEVDVRWLECWISLTGTNHFRQWSLSLGRSLFASLCRLQPLLCWLSMSKCWLFVLRCLLVSYPYKFYKILAAVVAKSCHATVSLKFDHILFLGWRATPRPFSASHGFKPAPDQPPLDARSRQWLWGSSRGSTSTFSRRNIRTASRLRELSSYGESVRCTSESGAVPWGEERGLIVYGNMPLFFGTWISTYNLEGKLCRHSRKSSGCNEFILLNIYLDVFGGQTLPVQTVQVDAVICHYMVHAPSSFNPSKSQNAKRK